MSLLSKFPHYERAGNFNLSLAFFGPLSDISKAIGSETSTGLVLPNTDFIQKFAEGDLGISDSFIKDMIFKNMNNPIASKNEAIFKHFAKLNKIDISEAGQTAVTGALANGKAVATGALTNVQTTGQSAVAGGLVNAKDKLNNGLTDAKSTISSKFKKGDKFVIPKDLIKIPEEMSMSGFKAFEKTVFQSIFETQKPFIEIVQIAIGSVTKAEDVIARVMPLFGSDPLFTKSRKPTGNSGSGKSRPKAIGYKGAAETKKQLQTLQQIKSKGETASNANKTNTTGVTSSIPVIKNNKPNESGFNSTHWQVVSTIYSTGQYDPKINYTYTYIDLPADPDLPPETPVDLGDQDPFENHKPKHIIFGIYNSKGVAIDPSEYLNTIGLQGNNKIEVVTPFKRADWILRSPKWKLPTDKIEWPNFGTPNFVWEKRELFGIGGIKSRVSKSSPGSGYSLKKYGVGDKNVLTGTIAIPNDPVITSFDAVEAKSYQDYYDDVIKIGLNKEDLSKEDNLKYNKDINDRLDVKPQLEITYNYGHIMSSYYNKVNNKIAFPTALKRSYKPFKIYSESAAKDLDLVKLATQKGDKPGFIWVDPEADYDMKVIRIDPITTIEYEEAKGAPELKTSIRQFVKNRTKFSFSNGATFSFSISKNNSDTLVFENINDYTFENWNYENKQIRNTNKFTINVWSKTAPKKYNKNYYRWPIKNSTLNIGLNDLSTTNLSLNNLNSLSNTITNNLGINNINTITNTITSNISLNSISSVNNFTNSIGNIGGSIFGKKIDYYYYIRKSDNIWYFDSNSFNYSKDGDFRLEDKTGVRVEKGIITRWYYIYDETFKGPKEGLNLPTFGIERSISINYEKDTIDVVDKNIPIWRLKTDDRYTSSVIIDPIQVTNNFLTKADLFINPDNDYYGHGSKQDPQNLGIIKRYALTDLDEESYYIVEGILKKDNEFETDENGNRINNGRGKGGGGWYRLPHAIGACSVFVRLLIDIGVRLIPKIAKLLALFQNPSKFVTDIMIEKLKKNFSFLSDRAISTFQKGMDLKNQLNNQTAGLDNIKDLINQTRLDARKLQDKLINDSNNKSSLEQSNAAKMSRDIQVKTEEKIKKLEEIGDKKKQLVKKIQKFYKESILANYVHFDEATLKSIFVLDGSATTPLKVFGADLSFGLGLNMGGLPTKPPIELIFPNTNGIFKNIQYLVKNQPEIPKNVNQPLDSLTKQEISNLKDPIKSQLSSLDKQPPYVNNTINGNPFSDKVQIKFEDGTYKYIPNNSLQSFVKENESKYNFIYVTEGLGKTLTEVNNLLISSQGPYGPNGSTQNDLSKAKELLDQAKKDFPDNSTVDDMLKELESINVKSAANTQPLLKTLLGFVKLPIKIVADIIKWMMEFFASLTNPMTLASKMKEFLSFEWILKFTTPPGILEILGVKYKPLTLIPFSLGASIVSGKLPNLSGVPHALSPSSGQTAISNAIQSSLDGVSSQLTNAQTFNLTVKPIATQLINTQISNVQSNIGQLTGLQNAVGGQVTNITSNLNNLKDKSGNSYNMSISQSKIKDAIKSATAGSEGMKMDLSKYVNIGFLPTLPTYTSNQYKNFLVGKQQNRLLPVLKMSQSIINKIIDFIWSLLGIEALKKAPHITITPNNADIMEPEDIKKILDGIEPKGNDIKTPDNPITTQGEGSGTIDTLNPGVQSFIYEIKLPDGTTKQYLNREDLDNFVQSNKDINYDFTFD